MIDDDDAVLVQKWHTYPESEVYYLIKLDKASWRSMKTKVMWGSGIRTKVELSKILFPNPKNLSSNAAEPILRFLQKFCFTLYLRESQMYRNALCFHQTLRTSSQGRQWFKYSTSFELHSSISKKTSQSSFSSTNFTPPTGRILSAIPSIHFPSNQ